jgi:hypothetical protein
MTQTFIDKDTQKAVDYVFEKLKTTYGEKWERSLTTGVDDAKSIWAYQLSVYTQSDETKKCILWACKHLPNHVPNVIEFGSLCRAGHNLLVVSHQDVEPSSTKITETIKKIKNKKVLVRPKDWAFKLKARHDAGEKLHPYQIACYQEALR